MKIYVVAAMHGDELFGLKIIGKLRLLRCEDLLIRVGHPEAIAKQTRFIETDLNRSFKTNDNSHESRIAETILKEIDEFAPDFIIDLHTSIIDVKKVAIVADLTQATYTVAHKTGMDSIVKMPVDIAKHSLLGCYPDKAVSLEFGKNHRSDKLAFEIAEGIASLTSLSDTTSRAIPTYQVTSTIPKNYQGLINIANLEYHPDLDGYPFLAGENTYQTIGGFLASKTDFSSAQ